jgi:hypothetical protein
MSKPVLILLRLIDSGVPAMGKMYYHCNLILEHLNAFVYSHDNEENVARQAEVVSIFEQR